MEIPSPQKVIGDAALSIGVPAIIIVIYWGLSTLKSWLDTVRGAARWSRRGLDAVGTGYRTLRTSTWGQRWALLVMTLCTPLIQLLYVAFCFVAGYYANMFVDSDKDRWNRSLEIVQTHPTSLLDREVFLSLYNYDFTVSKYFMYAGAGAILFSYMLAFSGKSSMTPGWILATPTIILFLLTGCLLIVVLILLVIRTVINVASGNPDWGTLVSGFVLEGLVACVPSFIFTGLFSATTLGCTGASEDLIKAWKGSR